MNTLIAGCLTVFLTVLMMVSPFPATSWAKTTPQTEIHVTLLGQACLLQGPFDETTLKAIHAIGPAQIYPNISSPDSPNAKELTHKALVQIRNSNSLPSLLDRYREKLGKRLDAQIAFFSGLEAGRKNQYSALLKTGKLYLRDEELKSFEGLLKKLSASKLEGQKDLQRDLIDQLFDLYNGAIEQDPEEEFHRAIKKLNVQYTCSFEESDE